jgi:hypothetical protein
MSITRVCDSCDERIRKPTYLSLSVQVFRTSAPEDQHSTKEFEGDYCETCIDNGKALADLLSPLKKDA